MKLRDIMLLSDYVLGSERCGYVDLHQKGELLLAAIFSLAYENGENAL